MDFLKGVKVIDISTLLPGGFCTMILADLGAEVIKVEPPGGDPMRYFPPFLDGESIYNKIINRDKKKIELDLKKTEDKEKLFEMIKTADVVIDNFRKKTAEKLGLTYEELRKVNPKIIHCSIRGETFESSDRPIHDLNAQGIAGILHLMKYILGKPERIPVPIADLASGLMCVVSVLASLVKKARTYEGSSTTVGLVESVALFNILAYATLIGNGKFEDLIGIGEKPYYNVYQTKDGGYITVAAIEEKFWRNLQEYVGEKLEREGKHSLERLKQHFKSRTLSEIQAYFHGKPSCIEKINTPEQALEEASIKQYLETRNGVKVVKTPIKYVSFR